MSLLFYPQCHTGTLRSEIDAFQHAPFTTISRYLCAKIVNILHKNEEIYENFLEISEKVPIFAARKEDDSSR
jgi:hypothetical protein